MSKSSIYKKADSFGITFSALCILHCISLPVVLSFSAFSSISSTLHELYYLEYIFLGLAFAAIYYASKKAKGTILKLAFWGTFMVLAVSFYLHNLSDISKSISILASVALIVLHLINMRDHKSAGNKFV